MFPGFAWCSQKLAEDDTSNTYADVQCDVHVYLQANSWRILRHDGVEVSTVEDRFG